MSQLASWYWKSVAYLFGVVVGAILHGSFMVPSEHANVEHNKDDVYLHGSSCTSARQLQ